MIYMGSRAATCAPHVDNIHGVQNENWNTGTHQKKNISSSSDIWIGLSGYRRRNFKWTSQWRWRTIGAGTTRTERPGHQDIKSTTPIGQWDSDLNCGLDNQLCLVGRCGLASWKREQTELCSHSSNKELNTLSNWTLNYNQISSIQLIKSNAFWSLTLLI